MSTLTEGGKMSRVIILVTITFAVVTSFAFADEQYRCTADSASGFYFNRAAESWQRTKIKADSKYTISKPEGSKWAFVVREMANFSPIATCQYGFDEAGFLFCKGTGYDFRFNRKNGRYLAAYLLGYYNVLPGDKEITDAKSARPYIEIGTCSPI
jgi:hypothetical protein